jgi:hypothetical protein
MPLRDATPPPDAAPLVSAGLADIEGARRPQVQGVAAAAAEPAPAQVLSDPHPVHTLGLDDLTAGRGLADAPLVAWRYMVSAGGKPAAAAEVTVDRAGRPVAFDHVNRGPFVAATARARKAAAKLPSVRDANVEVRVLRIPALYVMALWLKHLDGGEDTVIPLDPAPDFLEAKRAYTEDEFLQALAAPARARLAFDNRPRAR